MAKQSRRTFSITDAEMFEAQKTKRGFFIEDKTDFIAFDEDFKDPFADDWQTAIDAAETILQDETLTDQLTQLTNEVEKQMRNCRDKFQDSKYFIEKTFPDNVPVWNEFGYNNYDDARRYQIKMIQFMKNFSLVATKYKTQLIAKGYLQTKIDEIETLRTALDTANQNQELFKGNQPVSTQERINVYNDLWAIMVKVCTAGKRIFKNDFAKLQRYLLPPGEETAEAFIISGTVTDSVTNALLEDVVVNIASLNLSMQTGTNGKYGFGGVPDGDYTLSAKLPGYNDGTADVTVAGGIAVVKDFALVKEI